jgi:uncharacterized protein YmfQ (DUF2313 family)
MRDAQAYGAMLVDLLPPGLAWSRNPASQLGQLALGLGDEFARLDARAQHLIVESDPRYTVELLNEWEFEYGLPDPCAGESQTLAGRQQRLTARVIENGALSEPELIGYALALGFVITITKFDPYTCDSDCDATLYGPLDRFVWRVNGPAVTVVSSTCDSFCDEQIETFGNAVLECNMRRFNPPFAFVYFAYG